jgi:hypothetical protein
MLRCHCHDATLTLRQISRCRRRFSAEMLRYYFHYGFRPYAIIADFAYAMRFFFFFVFFQRRHTAAFADTRHAADGLFSGHAAAVPPVFDIVFAATCRRRAVFITAYAALHYYAVRCQMMPPCRHFAIIYWFFFDDLRWSFSSPPPAAAIIFAAIIHGLFRRHYAAIFDASFQLPLFRFHVLPFLSAYFSR